MRVLRRVLSAKCWVLGAALGAGCLVLSACEHESLEKKETEAPVPVTLDTATVEAIQSTIAASGLVTPAPGGEMTVVAPAQGRIAEMPKAEGDTVKAGDLLVRFDIPNLAADVASKRAAVAQATARLENAKANYTRLSGLLAEKVAAAREVEDARRQVAEAEADIEQAKSGVDASVAMQARAVVRATFAGVVSKRLHNPGDLVDASASDPILKVINPAGLQVAASVPVADINRVAVGRRASVTAAGVDTPEAARVLTRPAQVDTASATAPVRLAFNAATTLAAGTVVTVEILAEEHPQALVIPTASIVRDEGETFVMVAGPDNKAHKYPIAIGLMTREKAEVTSGLKAGDRVIVNGKNELPEGATIAIQR